VADRLARRLLGDDIARDARPGAMANVDEAFGGELLVGDGDG